MFFLVEIRGDGYRAMGLLAKVGIQNLYNVGDPASRGQGTARLSADDPDSAVERVRHALDGSALGGSGFSIGDVRPE